MTAVPTDLLNEIIVDALQRTGARHDECRVLRAEAVTWPNGSLGCPEPGVGYTEALVAGYWVILDVRGTRLDYRATRRGIFRLCSAPDAAGPLPSHTI